MRTNFRSPQVFSGNYSETATKDLDDDVAEENAIVEHYDYYPDSDLEDAEDLQATGGSSGVDPTTNQPHRKIYYEKEMREGRVIKIQDVAFITYVRSHPVHTTD